MDYRNRAIDHERRLITYVAENFRVLYDLARFTHITQLVQADAMTHAYRAWRRQWGTEFQRQCGGVLVWQLNDCWPTMSWSIVDYHLIPKPAFHAIKRALTRLAVGIKRPYHAWTPGHADPTIALTARKYEVWVSSSAIQNEQVDLQVRFISIKTGHDIAAPTTKVNVTIHANATTEIIDSEVDIETQPLAHEPIIPSDETTWVMNQAGYFRYPSKHRSDVPPFDLMTYEPWVVYAQIRSSQGGELLSEDIAWPDPLKYLDFGARGVNVRVIAKTDTDTGTLERQEHRETVPSERSTSQEATVVVVAITAQKPVKGFVFQEIKNGGHLSDNGFDIMPGVEKRVTFQESSSVGKQGEMLRWTYLGAESGEERM